MRCMYHGLCAYCQPMCKLLMLLLLPLLMLLLPLLLVVRSLLLLVVNLRCHHRQPHSHQRPRRTTSLLPPLSAMVSRCGWSVYARPGTTANTRSCVSPCLRLANGMWCACWGGARAGHKS